eukprot:Polyplicarium_translucidae@DN643_c0_g1_i1.p2
MITRGRSRRDAQGRSDDGASAALHHDAEPPSDDSKAGLASHASVSTMAGTPPQGMQDSEGSPESRTTPSAPHLQPENPCVWQSGRALPPLRPRRDRLDQLAATPPHRRTED